MIQQRGNTKHYLQMWHLKLIALQPIFTETFLVHHGFFDSKPILSGTSIKHNGWSTLIPNNYCTLKKVIPFYPSMKIDLCPTEEM
jgi:hypothetical protein